MFAHTHLARTHTSLHSHIFAHTNSHAFLSHNAYMQCFAHIHSLLRVSICAHAGADCEIQWRNTCDHDAHICTCIPIYTYTIDAYTHTCIHAGADCEIQWRNTCDHDAHICTCLPIYTYTIDAYTHVYTQVRTVRFSGGTRATRASIKTTGRARRKPDSRCSQ